MAAKKPGQCSGHGFSAGSSCWPGATPQAGRLHIEESGVSILRADEIGQEFEFLIQSFFDERGFTIFDTPSTNDYGADLLLYFHGQLLAIQCKYHAKPVGISAVQEVVSAVPYYGADVGVVISNQPFTKQARALAAVNQVLLIGGVVLDYMLADVDGTIPVLEGLLLRTQGAQRSHSSPHECYCPGEVV